MRHVALRLGSAAALAIGLAAGPVRGQEVERRPAEPIHLDSLPGPADTIAGGLPPGAGVIEEDSPRPWLVDPAGLYGLTLERYNRASGLVPAAGLTLESTRPTRLPSVGGWIGTPTTNARAYWSGWAQLRLPLPLPWSVHLRYEHGHRDATFDGWKLTPRENDLATLLVGEDMLEWWRERGWRLWLIAESPGGRFSTRLAIADLEQRSLRNRSPWTLFGEDFRPLPPVAEGTLHGLIGTGRLDTRDVQSPLLAVPGWWAEFEWERAGGFLGGDIAFVRGSVDVRRYNRIGQDAWWDGRVAWKGALTDRGVPPQRAIRLGGPGSLRGFSAGSFVGDEGLQASTEVRLPLPVNRAIALLYIQWHAVGFADLGGVDGDWHANLGAGVSGINIFSYLGFFVAQRVTDLDQADDGPRFIVRLRRDF